MGQPREEIDLSDHVHVTGGNRRLVKWLASALFVLLLCLVGAFSYSLYGANPPLAPARETIGIDVRRGEDGYFEVEEYILQQSGRGVTPQNNAAVPLLQAVWPPRELNVANWQPLCEALGMPVPPSQSPVDLLYDEPYASEFVEYFKKATGRKGSSADAEIPVVYSMSYPQTAEYFRTHPWPEGEFPQSRRQIEQESERIELLIEAASRPRFWLPSPTLLDDQSDPLSDLLLPHVSEFQNAGRLLRAAAMERLGRGETADAWRHLAASFHLAALLNEDPYLISRSLAAAHIRESVQATESLLGERQVPPELLERMQADLETVDADLNLADWADRYGRAELLDLASRPFNKQLFAQAPATPNRLAIGDVRTLWNTRLNWNRILRQSAEALEAMAAVERTGTPQQRQEAIDNFQLAIAPDAAATPITLLMSATAREEAVAGWLLDRTLRPSWEMLETKEVTLSQLERLRIGVALRRYASDHGRYPNSLADLQPDYLADIPGDSASGGEFRYEKLPGGACALSSSEVNAAAAGGGVALPATDPLLEFLQAMSEEPSAIELTLRLSPAQDASTASE